VTPERISLKTARLTRRRALCLAGSAVLGGLVGGCFSGSRPVRLTLWHVWRGRQERLFQEMLDRFLARNPGLEINSVPIAISSVLEKLVQAGRTHSLPDVFVINSGWLQTLVAKQWLANLGEKARADGLDLAGRLLSRDYERGFFEGTLLALPAVTSCATAMFYSRTRLLEQAGVPAATRYARWDELTEVSREVVGKLNRSSGLDVIGFDPFWGPGLQTFHALSFGLNTPTVSPDRRVSLINTAGPMRVARAMDDYVERVYGPWGGHRALLPWRQRHAGIFNQTSVAAFSRGEQVFTLGGVWVLGDVLADNPALDLAVQPVPGLEGLHGGTNGHAWAYAMNRGTAHPKEAWSLLRYVSVDEEGNGRYCAALRRSCPIATVNDWPEFRNLGPVWAGVREAMAGDVPFDTTTDQEYLRPMLFEVPLRRVAGERIETIFKDIHRRYQTYLDKTRGDK